MPYSKPNIVLSRSCTTNIVTHSTGIRRNNVVSIIVRTDVKASVSLQIDYTMLGAQGTKYKSLKAEASPPFSSTEAKTKHGSELYSK